MEFTPGTIMEGTVRSIANFGAFINLPEGKNGIVSRLTEKYDVDEATAAENVRKVVETLKKTGLIAE